MILYRPVGTAELELIEQSGYASFPPRLPDQPIFYPVLNEEYACEIAEKWNTRSADGKGYVTRFTVDDEYVRRHAVQTVGNRRHQELWIPAEELDTFNDHIIGPIEVIREFSRDERYLRYRDELLKAGFSEAKMRRGNFFLKTAEQTAFIIGLDSDGYGVSVLYGFAAIPNMGDETEKWFSDHGSDDTTCHVRSILYIHDGQTEAAVNETISRFYSQYKDCSKDEILTLKEEKQNAFLDRFACALKPLGFRKKRARWTRDLKNGTSLVFEAQKSMWSDQYYFNVIVRDAANVYKQHSIQRVARNGKDIYNWQLMTEEQIDGLIELILTQYIVPKITD